jgi:hypothetical protein
MKRTDSEGPEVAPPGRGGAAAPVLQLATVAYEVATAKGKVKVLAHPSDDDAVLVARAKRRLETQVGALPFGRQSWRVLRREAAP